MFQRQWFEKHSQLGLTEEAKKFDNYLKLFKYSEAISYGTKLCGGEKEIKAYWERRTNVAKKIFKYITEGNDKRKIYINGFWPGFKRENNLLVDLLRAALPNRCLEVTDKIEESDIIIESCYGRSITDLSKNTLNILFLGENVRPTYSQYDVSLTSDIYNYCGRNIYLPIWALEIDWFGKREYEKGKLLYTYEDISTPKQINRGKRIPEFVYIGNNNEPVRISMIRELEKAGFRVNKYGSQTNPVKDKIGLLKKYKYTLCMENSVMEGYVTEKPIHAYLSGCIAIYRGGHGNSGLKINHSTGFFALDQYNNDVQLLISELNKYNNIEQQKIAPLIDIKKLEDFKQNCIKSLSKNLGWI